MYIGFNSKVLAPNQITDYLVRVVQPKLQSVEGVQTAELLGAKNFALRAWLDPQKLAAYGLTAADVSPGAGQQRLHRGPRHDQGPDGPGHAERLDRRCSSLEEFRNLVLKQQDGAIVRLSDVANVTLGSDDYESEVGFDGQKAVYIGIQVAPAANLLDVIKGVRDVFPDDPGAAAAGAERPDHLRLDGVREQLDRGGDPHAGRGAGDRDAGGVRLPGLARARC